MPKKPIWPAFLAILAGGTVWASLIFVSFWLLGFYALLVWAALFVWLFVHVIRDQEKKWQAVRDAIRRKEERWGG